MIVYYVLLIGQLVLGVYDSKESCQAAQAKTFPQAVCEQRQTR